MKSLLFCSLEKFCVEYCQKLEKIPFQVNSATHLQMLDLNQCAKMVEIIEVGESEMTNGDPKNNSFFPCLKEITLNNMQTLKSICKAMFFVLELGGGLCVQFAIVAKK